MGESPWQCQPVENSINKRLLELFRGERDGYVQVGPEKYLFPQSFAKDGPDYYYFEPRPTDTWVVTYPRSGTTLTQEMVWLIGNNFDYSKAAEVPLIERFPFFEWSSCYHPKVKKELMATYRNNTEKSNKLEMVARSRMEELNNTKDRRFIKTHLPFSLLNPNLLTCGAKVIYVARNPKDVSISYFHLHKLFRTLDFVGTFEEFSELFQNDLVMWSPYWNHINEGWNLKNNPNVHFLFYEDIVNDMENTIKRVAEFMNKSLNEAEMKQLLHHLDKSTFGRNKSVNFEVIRELDILNNHDQKFVRTNGLKSEFTPKLSGEIDNWIFNNLNKSSITFPGYIKE